MARASIPVDLFNPGQVFACLGLMEAAESLFGNVRGGFFWEPPSRAEFAIESDSNMRGRCSSSTHLPSRAEFAIESDGCDSAVLSVFEFLESATVSAAIPVGSQLSVEKWSEGWGVGQEEATTYPSPIPQSPEPLAAYIVGKTGERLLVEHWADGSIRDSFKLWTGAQGTPGAAVLARLVSQIQDGILDQGGAPLDWSLPQGSGFRLDWRRDYVPIDVGFSPNKHKSRMVMAGYPLVEVLAVVGLGAARPARVGRGKLHYRYSVLGVADAAAELLPLSLHRAALGAAPLPFPQRFFEMELGWPGQEGQARCILEVNEETQS